MSASNQLVLPQRFHETAFLNPQAGIVHIDRRTGQSPHFRSWLEESQALGHKIEVVKVDLDVIARLKRDGVLETKPTDGDDRAVRESALTLIRDSAFLRVSDIHILRGGEFTEIQVRIDGKLLTMERMSLDAGDRLIRAVYQGIATSRDAQFEHGSSQNAQISGDVLSGTGLTSIRVVRGPCHPVAENGNFAILRLQYEKTHKGTAIAKARQPRRTLAQPRQPEGELHLAAMGFSPRQVEKLLHLISAPEGGILLTAPTGHGKTTTIHELLAHLARKYAGKRQITIEDPIEYPMPWAIQLDIRNAQDAKSTGAKAAELLRTALRMDPDIVLVGEVRDAEVAQTFIDAALTGHLVLSTLHVSDPFLFVERLEAMDKIKLHAKSFCDPNIIRGSIAQRLVPLLCRECRVPLSERPDAIDGPTISALKTYGSVESVHVQGNGCPNCLNSGTSGRRAVAEVVVCDDELMSDFVSRGTAEARLRYRKRPDADPTMVEAGIALALEGLIDPAEITGKIGCIEPKRST